MASNFQDQMNTGVIGYLEQCAEYLAARGLDYRELSIITQLRKDWGVYLDVGGGKKEKYTLEGWGFRVKDKWGEPLEMGFLMRVVNWPDDDLYTYIDKKFDLLDRRPKFIQMGKWNINWVSTAAECKASSTMMIHEKFTCAYLSVKHLGIPSIGLSGCQNWCAGGAMNPDLRDVIYNMPQSSTIYVCFDGDILGNDQIMFSAQKFQGYVESMRPDITCVFPMVPGGFGGWDDWAVTQDDIAGNWVRELNAQRVDVTGFLNQDVLINTYGLAYKLDKDDNKIILHTTDNYIKLIKVHPKWADYVLNIDDMMYDKEDPSTPLEYEDVARKVEIWLTNAAFRGAQAERVSSDKCIKAVKEVMCLPDRKFSLPHYHIEKWPLVSDEVARQVAERLITDGIRVVGPMTKEETIETMLRVFRDMVGMWSYDWSWSPQWMLALVGPSNAGKSDFPRSVLRPLLDAGFIVACGKLYHTGDKAKPEEMARVLKTCLAGVVDEYNPPERQAKLFEDQLLSVVADRIVTIRKMRENNAKPHLRNASVFLTTTDKNRQYLRSGKGEGVERRAITMEVVPFWDYEGKLSSNRAVVAECSKILLRWGLEAYRRGMSGSATEFSVNYASQYLAEDDTLRNVGKALARVGSSHQLDEAKGKLFRSKTGDWRFSPTQLYEFIYPGERITREQGQKLQNLAVDCGAVFIGKARVNGLRADSKEVIVDKAMCVGDWEAWAEAMSSALGA